MAKSKTLYCLSGRLGIEDGMDADQDGMVSEDNDGEYPSGTYNWVLDIPRLLSRKLGKQMSQMATYRVKGMHLSLRNVNNSIDNDAALQIGGNVIWMSPTKHRIDALQFARKYKQQTGILSPSDGGDPYSTWNNGKEYMGIRYNWDADGQISGQTTDETTVLAGSYFALDEILYHYNQVIGGTPTDEGYDTDGEGMALWTSRTGHDEHESIYWDAGYTNASPLAEIPNSSTLVVGEDMLQYNPHARPWNFLLDNNHLSVLGGLMKVTAYHGNTDMAGWTEDEYYIQCTIMVEGWEEF